MERHMLRGARGYVEEEIMTTYRMPGRASGRRRLARAGQLVRYLVEDVAGIITDLRYEIRDRLLGASRRGRRDRARRPQ